MAARVRTAEETVAANREMSNISGQALTQLCAAARDENAGFEAAIIVEEKRKMLEAQEEARKARLTLPPKPALCTVAATTAHSKANSRAVSLKTTGCESWASGTSLGARWTPLVRHWAADTEPASPITTKEVGRTRRAMLFTMTPSAHGCTRSFSPAGEDSPTRKLDFSYWKGLSHGAIWGLQPRSPCSEPVTPIVLAHVGEKRRDILFKDLQV